MNIQEISEEISGLNSQMLKLFIRRLELTNEAGKLRMAEGKPLYDRKTEEKIIQEVVESTPQDMQNYSIEFFRSLIKLSKEYYNDNR